MRFGVLVRVVALAVLAVLALAGCGTASTIEPVDRALAAAGFTAVDVQLGAVEEVGDVASVTASAPASLPDEQGYGAVARIVWTTLPVRIDGLEVVLDGQVADIKRDGLERLLGPRNPELDRRTIADTTTSSAITIAVVGALVLLVVVGLVALIVRARRRRRADELLRGQFGPPAPQAGPYPPGPYPPGPSLPGPSLPGPYPPGPTSGRYPPGPYPRGPFPPGGYPPAGQQPQPGYEQPPAGL